MIKVELPVSQDRIKGEVTRVLAEIERLDTEKRSALALLQALQAICSHPGTERESGNTQGRWPYFKCKVCQKEW